MDFSKMNTPALVLDVGRVKANANRMLQHCQNKGVLLRPHMKTPKCVEIAKIATAGRMNGLTVSTLAEAEVFANAGFDDILYAVGITPNKFGRVAALTRKTGKTLVLTLDSIEMANAIASSDLDNPVLIEIDCGESRGGLSADDPALPEIARILGKQFRGIMSHAGHSYTTDQISGVKEIAQSEFGAAVSAADRLRGQGIAVEVVSAGSTPTVLHSEDFSGITEVRAGIYLLNDLAQFGRNICQLDDIALSVLAAVIGHNRAAGVMTIDAGALALSKDIGANKFLPHAGFGWVCDAETLKPTGLAVDVVHQEHGSIKVDDPSMFDQLPIGSVVCVLPNHACLTAAGGYGEYHLTDGNIWLRHDGW
ncbi:MAG: alanine racemase [Rhodobacteraceae bacterium]|nr:alanine racemase [Paracoccaceae bacterium]